MRQSKLFTKTSKEFPKDEVSLNAQLLIKAGFVNKLMAGVYTLLPMGLKVYKKVEQIIREEMNAVGGQEVYMPTLQPKERWEKTGRYETVDDLFRFTSYYSKMDYVLGPTHEEVVAPLVGKFVFSYKDLPVSVYHIQNKFRDEKRAKSGILRSREFMMKDLYSFHAHQADLDDYYERIKASYLSIFRRVGIGSETYLTYASGGTFSKYSHEFQTLTDAGEDLIYICDICKIAVNKEILADQDNKCPVCGNKDLREAKAVEVGNIFKLGTKFSEPFSLFYNDENGKKHPVIMGCYGIGLQRLIGTVVEVKSDDKGMIWPASIAPFAVHLISLNQNAEAEKLYEELKGNDVDVLYDDRDLSAGEKFADSDLIGIPKRLIVSAKMLKEASVGYKERDKQTERQIKRTEIIDLIKHD